MGVFSAKRGGLGGRKDVTASYPKRREGKEPRKRKTEVNIASSSLNDEKNALELAQKRFKIQIRWENGRKRKAHR